MQQAQVSKHRWIVGLQFFSIVWFVAYLGIMLFYPSLGPTVTRLLDRAATAVLVWVGIVGFPACSVGMFVYLSQNAKRRHVLWTFFVNLALWIGLATILCTLVWDGHWIDVINLNTPAPVPDVPFG